MKYSNGKETRDTILKISRKLFFKKNFKDVSIREIARNANVSSGTLYKHFSSKEDILDNIVSPYVNDWWEKCDDMLKEFENDLAKAKTKENVKNAIMRNSSDWIYNYFRSNLDIWKFVFFKSSGTKYENFLNDFIDYEVSITLKVLNKIDKDKKYLEIVSDTEIYFITKGSYSMAMSVFDDRFDDDMRMNYFSILEGMYKPFWAKIFTINF